MYISYACDPEPYAGDLHKCRGFILHCRLVFVLRACLFPSEQSKINYMISLLRGRALALAQANVDAQTFISCLERVFDCPNFIYDYAVEF